MPFTDGEPRKHGTTSCGQATDPRESGRKEALTVRSSIVQGRSRLLPSRLSLSLHIEFAVICACGTRSPSSLPRRDGS